MSRYAALQASLATPQQDAAEQERAAETPYERLRRQYQVVNRDSGPPQGRAEPKPTYGEMARNQAAQVLQGLTGSTLEPLLGAAALAERMKPGVSPLAGLLDSARQGVHGTAKGVFAEDQAAVEQYLQGPDAGMAARIALRGLPQGAGSAAGFLGGGAALGGGKLAMAGLGALQNGIQAYYEAKEAGADETKAAQALVGGAFIGTSEGLLGLGRALGALSKATGGAAPRRIVYQGLKEGGEEAVQEGFQGLANNLMAQKLWDPERGLAEGVTDAMIVGAILGTGIGGAVGAAQGLPEAGAPAETDVSPDQAAREAMAPPGAEMPSAFGPEAVPLTSEERTAISRENMGQALPLGPGGTVIEPVATLEAQADAYAAGQRGMLFVDRPADDAELQAFAEARGLKVTPTVGGAWVSTKEDRPQARKTARAEKDAASPEDVERIRAEVLGYEQAKPDIDPTTARVRETLDEQDRAISQEVVDAAAQPPAEGQRDVPVETAIEQRIATPPPPAVAAPEPIPPAEAAPAVTTEAPRGAAEVAGGVAPAAKRPWQMTRKEWEAAREAVRPRPELTFSGSSMSDAGVTKAGNAAARKLAEVERLTYGVRDIDSARMKSGAKLTPEEFEDIQDRLGTPVRHRDVIAKAIAEGQPVPPEVLSDYPDLAPVAGPEAAPLTPESVRAEIEADESMDPTVTEQEVRAEVERMEKAVPKPEPAWTQALAFPPPLFEGLTRPSTRQTGGESFVGPESTMDAIRRRVQDKFLRVQRATEASKKVTEATDVPGHIEVFEGKVEEHIRRGEDRFIEPIKRLAAGARIPIFMDPEQAPAASEKPPLDLYLLARGAKERNAVIAERTKGEITADAGLDTETAQAIVQAAESGPQGAVYKDIGERYDTFNRQALKIGRRSGLVSQEQIDAYAKTFGKHYAPRRTDMDAETQRNTAKGRGFGVPKRPLSHRAEGRTSLPDSPLVFSLIQYNQAAVLGEKNLVSESLAKLIEDNPAPDYWRVRKDGAKVEEGGFKATPENTIPFKRDGEVYLIETADPLLARAMLNLGAERSGRVVQLAAKLTRYLAAVRTSYSPRFILRNFLKDIQTAFVNLSGDEGYKMAARAVANAPRSIKAVNAVLKNDSAPGEYEDHFREMRENGGTVGWFHAPSYEEHQKRIVKDLEALRKGPASARSIYGAVRAIGEWVEIKNRAVENGVRLAAYAEARKAGHSPFRSAHLAKNLTVNFNKSGEWGAPINAFWMFYKASVNSTARQLQALKKPKVQAIVFTVTAAGFLESILNRMLGGEDDDGEDHYDKIGEFIKRGNWIIAAPPGSFLEDFARSLPKFFRIETEGGGHFLRMPMPYGYGLFHDLGRQIADVATGEREPGEAAASFAVGAWDSLFPFGSSAPTLVEPAMQIQTNKQYGDRPIYPENPFGPPSSDAAQAFDGASNYSRVIARWFNEVTGGDEVSGGFADVHPDTLDYLVAWATGGLGKFMLDAKKLADHAAGKDQVATPRDIPFWSDLVGAPWEGWTRDRFYQNVEAFEEAKRRAAKGLKLDDDDYATLSLAELFRLAVSQVRKLNKAEKSDERDAELDRLMSGINRAVLDLKAPDETERAYIAAWTTVDRLQDDWDRARQAGDAALKARVQESPLWRQRGLIENNRETVRDILRRVEEAKTEAEKEGLRLRIRSIQASLVRRLGVVLPQGELSAR